MQELFLYDREKGLFKEILKQSVIMKGSYHVSAYQGQDLNTENLETFAKSLAIISDKAYPICVCLTPRSRFIKLNGQRWEQFTFTLFFLTTTFYTSNNEVKFRDAATGASGHHVWYDWQDMKSCADQFIEVLKAVLKKPVAIDDDTRLLQTLLAFNTEEAVFKRLTKFNNDQLSGVSVSFSLLMSSIICDYPDYPNLDGIVIPPLIIHEPHE